MRRENSQQGSVLFYILIAVLLFAALSYAVSGMLRGSSNPVSERDSLMATGILDYAKNMRQAVQVMRVSTQCDEADISFEKSPFDGSDAAYVNASAPTDFSCHVFHPSGGGVGYMTAQNQEDWSVTGHFYINNVGTSAVELVAILPVSRDLCAMINTKLDISNSTIETLVSDGAGGGNTHAPYVGSFTSTGSLTLAAHSGKMAGCYKSSASSGTDYTFYQVLIAR